ncbi:intraflagellar transport protein 172 homolog isoform X2 [Convolutriloba macropyga]|uniref:intraflagellar transport protein 172 homolog isoform X2 n=1 Tax=Convolutriloba macropyga TaxID=536237 RepID=UPI003F52436D
MANYELKLKYCRNISNSARTGISSLDISDGAVKVQAAAWSHDGKLFAFVNAAKRLYIYDAEDLSTHKEVFSLKAKEKNALFGVQSFTVKGIAFHPSGTKIAIAQSDDVVFMYRFQSSPGVWDGKKSICNKFLFESTPTCIYWPRIELGQEFDKCFFVGNLQGEVRKCKTNSKKTQGDFLIPQKIVPPHHAFVCALAPNPENGGFVASYADGLIVIWAESNGQYVKMGSMKHSVAAYALATTNSAIVAAGADMRIAVYRRGAGGAMSSSSMAGELMQSFDYSSDKTEKEFTCACSSAISETVAVASYDRVRTFNWNATSEKFVELSPMEIKNLYTITVLQWRPDGTNLLLGTHTGLVEMLEVSSPKSVVNGVFEIQYFGPKQVLVRNTKKNTRCVLRSQYNYPITKVNVCGGKSSDVNIAGNALTSDKRNRYLVAYTSDTLLIADFLDGRMSEVQWTSGGNEKFYFEIEKVCVIFNAGEMSLVEYGNNEFLGTVRTEFTNPHQFSVRINERTVAGSDNHDNKKLAYLVDLKTIEIVDLMGEASTVRCQHASKIKWLELNETGRKLLFRDVKYKLYLLDVKSEEKVTMLDLCQFVQWVPQSDVIVAQNREFLCVWYNIDSPDKVSMFPIKGEVREVLRELVRETDGRERVQTRVLVDEKLDMAEYLLDSDLIAFGAAVESGQLTAAMNYLENLDATPETAAHWRTLAKLSLDQLRIPIAQRCYAELGDIAKARYLKKIVDMAHSRGFDQYEPEDSSLDHDTKMAYMWRNLVEREPDIKAKILMLKKDFFMAQNTYLENDMLDDAIEMFVKIGKWEQALQLASDRNHPDLDKLRAQCKEWLKVHHQQEKIAALYESEGQYESAIFEYVKAGMPSKAANQMMKRQELMSNSSLLDTVIKELCEREFYIKAGELYEKAKVNDRALKLYRMAKDKEGFSNAVRLAREHDLGVDARDLLEEYADYLYEHMEFEMAMEKYLQASELIKALKSAFRANSIVRAEDIFETIKESPGGKESFDRVNKTKTRDGEEELSYNGWAIKLGQYYATLPSGNRERNMKKAQKYFLEANSLEHIIQMYKDAGYWEKAFEYLVEIGATKEATEFLEEQAQICINEKRYSDAERVYTKGKMFESIVEMYKSIEDFDNVLRVQRRLGMGNDTSMLIEHAERRKRDGDFYEAEKLYMEAGNWKEAVNMYMQQGKWEDARRVCQEVGTEESRSKEGFIGYCWAKDMPSVVNAAKLLLNLNLLDKVVEVSCNAIASEAAKQEGLKVPDFDMAFDLCNAAERPDLTARVHLLKGQFLEDQGQFQLAETEFIAAGKPNEALLMYIHEGMLDAAQKVADAHCTVEEKNQVYTALGNKKFEKGDYDSAEKLFLKSDNVEHLVSLYLDINRLDKVHDLADRGYLTPEQLNNLSAMRRREPVSGGVGASGSVGSAGDISGMSGASKIVEANRLASNTNSPHDMREALKLLFSITSYDVTATATSSVDEQLLHYNQQAMKLIETLCIQNGGRFVENLGASRGDGPFRDSNGQSYTMKLSDVVSTVLTRQTSLQGDWKKGVSLCLNLYNALTKVNMVEEGDRYVDFAVKFACVHQQYSAASKIVNHAYEEDHPVARDLLQYIKQQAVAASRQEGDMEGLVAMGEGFDELKQTGDYARYLDLVHKKDRENGTTNMPGALRKCIRSLLDQVESAGDSKRNANMSKLFSIMEDYGPLADNSQDVRNVFKAIFEKLTSSPMPGVEVLSTQPEDYKPAAFRNEWTVEYAHFDKMRKILLKEVDSNAYSGDMLNLLSTLFVVCHLSANRAACMTASKLFPLAAKVSMAMTMYIHEVPADKVFLEAGIVTRLASMSTNEEIPEERKDFLRKMAFLFVNTFIDTVEQAMEGETDFSSEYLGDLEPIRERGEILVPKNAQQCVLKDESVFESLKDWVLTVSMDNSIDFSSDMSIANNASSSDSGQVFEACPATSQGEKICCITGYPIKKPGGGDIRAVGSYPFSINNSDRGLLQTAKMVGGMGNDSFEDRETIKKLTNDDFDFLVKKMGVNSQF